MFPQDPLDLDLATAEPMSLVPVYFRPSGGTIGKADGCDAFEFSPAARAIHLPQTSQFSDLTTRCDDLDGTNGADNLNRRSRPFRHLFPGLGVGLTTWPFSGAAPSVSEDHGRCNGGLASLP